MSARELLDGLRDSGVFLDPDGDRLRVRDPRGVITPGILTKLKEQKPKVMAFLSAEIEEANLERRFGHKAARLYPSLGRKVQTPKGEGRLWQVFTVRVGVVLDDSPERVTDFEPDEVRPSPGGQSPPHRPMG